MEINKYHGCGNDFLIAMDPPLSQTQKKQLVIALCERHTGIGADGFIFVSMHPLEMKYYNRDGSRAWMCGNGIRCFAKYLWDTGRLRKQHYIVQSGPHHVEVNIQCQDPFTVAIDLGIPSIASKWIQSSDQKEIWGRKLTVNEQEFIVDTLYVQTIHTVVLVENAQANWEKIGEVLHCHPLFLAKTNVNLAEVIDRDHVRIVTYERGVGLTNACGTGCAAVAWDMWKHGICDNDVTLLCAQGTLQIHIDPANGAVTLIGGAQKIMSGAISDTFIHSCLDEKAGEPLDHNAY